MLARVGASQAGRPYCAPRGQGYFRYTQSEFAVTGIVTVDSETVPDLSEPLILRVSAEKCTKHGVSSHLPLFYFSDMLV